MKKILIVLLPIIWICSLGLDVAYAQEPTPTPTIEPADNFFPDTFTGDFSSLDRTCPEFGVNGWGSCTPSPLWMMYCDHCVNDSFVATVQPGGSDPETYEDDDLPTMKSYASEAYYKDDNPMIIYEEFLTDTEFTSEKEGFYYWKMNGAEITLQNVDGTYYIYHEGRGIEYAGITQQLRLRLKNNNHPAKCSFVYTDSLGNEFITGEMGYSATRDYIIEEWQAHPDAEIEFTYNIEVLMDMDGGNPVLTNGCSVDFDYLNHINGETYTREQTINWHRGGTVLSGGSCYCCNVECLGESEFDTEFPSVGLGETVCLNLGPAEYHPLGWDIEIPHILHLCFTSVSLGTVSILGVVLNADQLLIAVLLSFLLVLMLQA